MSAAGERAAPRGTLTITAPPISGEEMLRPVDRRLPEGLSARSRRGSICFDRPVNLIDEGIDVALRIADLPDSSFVAIRRRRCDAGVIAASPPIWRSIRHRRAGRSRPSTRSSP